MAATRARLGEVAGIALEVSRYLQADDKPKAANAMSHIVGLLFSSGNWTQCLDWLRKEITIREQIGDHLGLANAFHNLGRVYSAQGDFRQSADCYNRVISLADRARDYQLQVRGLSDLAAVSVKSGDVPLAILKYEEALSLLRAFSPHQITEISTLNALGYLHLVNREPALALDCLTQALQLYRDTHEGNADPTILVQLGRAYYEMKRYKNSIDCWNNAALLFQEMGQVGLVAKTRAAVEVLTGSVKRS